MMKGWQFLLFGLLLAAGVAACAPRVVEAPPPPPLEVTPLGSAEFNALVAPFGKTLGALGVAQYDRYWVYRYGGVEDDAFISATNEFYLQNPGFCPLVENAFFASETGTQFMTLAGNNTNELRGFLYDQSQRPRLTYAYFAVRGNGPFQAIVCETANR
jgi:hypothetical protein